MKSLSLLSGALLLCLIQPAFAKLKVVSTVPDLGELAREIGGERVSLTTLVKGTQDPHFVDARPSMALALNQADLLLHVGMQLEVGWLPPLLNGARNSKILPGAPGYLDCSTFIHAVEVPTGAPDRAHGDIHPGGNPHYWIDPRRISRVAVGIAARLSQLDPENSEHYQVGLESFQKKLAEHIERWRAALAPYKGARVVVFHRSWSYFVEFAGLKIMGELEPKPGIEPSPSHVATLLKRVRDQKVRLVLQEFFYPYNLSKIFAKKAGAKLLILPTMTGASKSKDYFEMMDRLIGMVVEGLK